jgi:hypothetical protein
VDALTDEKLIAASRLVIAKVERACLSWRFRDLNLATATAAMARAAALLDQAIDLAEKPPSIGANILVRSAFECWLVGAWALFGGSDALVGIEKERIRNERLLAAKNDLPEEAAQHLDTQHEILSGVQGRLLGGNAPSSVKYEDMAKELGDRITEQTREHEDADVLALYNLLYRAHSTNDAHPWKPVGQYITEGGLGMRVEAQPPWNNPVESIRSMSMYLAILGRWIDEARGGSDPEWNDCVVVLSAS